MVATNNIEIEGSKNKNQELDDQDEEPTVSNKLLDQEKVSL